MSQHPSRRRLLQGASALGLLGLTACASTASIPSRAKVVVIGGGIADHVLPEWFFSSHDDDNFFFASVPQHSAIFIKETKK